MTVPWQKCASTSFTGDVALTAATEAVVATIPGISTDGPAQTIRLIGFIQMTGQAGTTTLTLRFRRSSLTGTLVGEANAITAAGAVTGAFPHETEDNPGDVASLSYVLTATVAGGNGTAIMGYALALIGG